MFNVVGNFWKLANISFAMTRNLKIVFALLLITVSFSFDTLKDCKLLADGNYRLTYTANTNESGSLIQINKNTFCQRWDNGRTENGKIKWIYNCTFILDYDNKPKQDTGEVGQLLVKSFGEPCIELKERIKNTITFRTTHVANLHITLNEGKLVRVE
jgi:hypothetical protein